MSADRPDNFRPIHNPYIVGNPIKDAKMFFGREDDFNYIKQKVTGKKGGLLVLCGSRRSGKTSILFQVLNGRLGDEFFPVLIDMQAVTVENDLDFLIKIGQGILNAIKDPNISLERDFLSKRGEGSLAAFQHLIAKINESLAGKKLVLLFDEYEIFESHIEKGLISKEVLNLFANWIEHSEGVFIIFTGSDRLEERKSSYWGHFLPKAAAYRRISFLSRKDALRLVNEPVEGLVAYEDGMPERIYELTAGQPFYTQVFCQALVDHANEVQEAELAGSDLQDVIDQIIENPLPQMIFSWNSLTPIEKVTLSIIGEINKNEPKRVRAKDVLSFAKGESIGLDIDPNILNETLEKLFYHDILSKDNDETYAFKMDLWRRWMGRMHSIWQVIDEVKSTEGGLGEGLSVTSRHRARNATFAAALAAAALVVGFGVWDNFFSNSTQNLAGPAPAVARDSTWVTIRTEPARARVFFGTQLIGEAPIEHLRVAAGTTPLRLEMIGYHDQRDTLQLVKEEALVRDYTLVERTGAVKVTSNPSGADVYLGGERKGQTPLVLEKLSINDRYDIRLRLAGYVAREFPNVEVLDGDTRSFHHDFQRSTSQIQITSDPSGADIYVDGQQRGKTPDFLTLQHGSHRIVVKKAGYYDNEESLDIPRAGDRHSFTLAKLPPGTLVIKVMPYADVFIDDVRKATGTSRHEERLEVGVHTITLSHPTFGTRTRTVEIRSGEQTTIDENMQNASAQQ